jgi:hypothetical protein
MKGWQKGALITLAMVLIASGYLFYVFKSRQDPGVAVKQGAEPRTLTSDELAVVKLLYLPSFSDAKDQLEGKPLWVKAGYSLPYYPYTGNTVQFTKRVGVLPSAEKLSVVKLIKAAAPAKEDDRVPHGTRQYFEVFTLNGNSGQFAAPIGFAEGDDEKLFTDQLFYYDDPKTIYSHWPPAVWDAIAKHTPTIGMTENQVRMAVGIMLQSDSTREGDRTVTYDAGGKKWTATFVKGAATQVNAA